MALQLNRLLPSLRTISFARMMSGGGWGSGKGKGGGSGGTIRDAGGAFGEMEAAREEEYFRRLQQKQLKDLRQNIDKQISFSAEQIKDHEEAIARHKKKIAELESMRKKDGYDSD